MKLDETETTVTTLDTTATFARNVYGGSPLQMRAVVTTTERGTYVAGAPDWATRDIHAATLARLGLPDFGTTDVTRGRKTIVELAPVQVLADTH